MDIEQARTFLEIAESGTFVKAAERLNITQSTASMQIKSLEDSLGRPLFTRSKAGAQLTAAGQQFRRYATTVVRAWQQARQDVALPPGFRAVLGIGGQYSLWDRLLIKWVPWIRTAMPDVAVRAEVGTPETLIRQLGEGLLDIVAMYAPQNRTGFVVEQLFTDRIVMVSTQKDASPILDDRYVYVDWGPAFHAGHTQAFPDFATPAVSVGNRLPRTFLSPRKWRNRLFPDPRRAPLYRGGPAPSRQGGARFSPAGLRGLSAKLCARKRAQSRVQGPTRPRGDRSGCVGRVGLDEQA